MSNNIHQISYYADPDTLIQKLEDLNVLNENQRWFDNSRNNNGIEYPDDENHYMEMTEIPTFIISPDEPIYINFPMRVDVHRVNDFESFEPQPSTSQFNYDANIYEELHPPSFTEAPIDVESEVVFPKENNEKKKGAIRKAVKFMAATPKKIKTKFSSMKKKLTKRNKYETGKITEEEEIMEIPEKFEIKREDPVRDARRYYVSN